MTRPILIAAICAATGLFAAGCNKADVAQPPTVTQKAAPAQAASPKPDVAVPPMPDPNVPKGAEAAAPKPGQAGDHSSPAFKAGGKTDPHK